MSDEKANPAHLRMLFRTARTDRSPIPQDFSRSGSIIRMAQKPTPQEFKQTSIVCGIGLFVLGAIGFILLVIMDNFIPWLIHDVFGI